MGKLEEVQEHGKSSEKSRLIPNFVLNPQESLEVSRSLPPELFQLLFLHNRDLHPASWGVCVMIWVTLPFFPLPTLQFQKCVNLKRKVFWRIIDELVKRKVFTLKYPRFSNLFHPVFCDRPSSILADGTPRPSSILADGPNYRPSSILADGTPRPSSILADGTPPSSVLAFSGGGGLYIPPPLPTDTPSTIADVKVVLEGEAFECFERLFPDAHPGHLLPHLRIARRLPGDPALRLRGAVFYRYDLFRRGVGGRMHLSLLMRDVQEGHSLPPPSELSRKPILEEKIIQAAADQAAADQAAADQAAADQARSAVPQGIVFAAEIQARISPSFEHMIAQLEATYRENPAWPEVRLQVEGMVSRGFIKLKGKREAV